MTQLHYNSLQSQQVYVTFLQCVPRKNLFPDSFRLQTFSVPLFLQYFVFLFLPHLLNSKFVFKYHLSWVKCAESIILLKSPIFALIRCLVYLQRCRSVYLQKGSSLEATVVGAGAKSLQHQQVNRQRQDCKSEKGKVNRHSQACTSETEAQGKNAAPSLSLFSETRSYGGLVRLKLRSANRFYRILDVLHPVHQGWSLSLSST